MGSVAVFHRWNGHVYVFYCLWITETVVHFASESGSSNLQTSQFALFVQGRYFYEAGKTTLAFVWTLRIFNLFWIKTKLTFGLELLKKVFFNFEFQLVSTFFQKTVQCQELFYLFPFSTAAFYVALKNMKLKSQQSVLIRRMNNSTILSASMPLYLHLNNITTLFFVWLSL